MRGESLERHDTAFHSAWQTHSLLLDSRSNPSGSHRVSEDEVLGFDGRRLMVKTVYYREDPEITWQKVWRVEREGSIQPLLQASRDLRIEAMNHIEPLINALIEKGKQMTKGLEKRRNTVNNI